MSALPIHAVLPDLLAALRTGSNAVLVAPPGAGKTTAVAPADAGPRGPSVAMHTAPATADTAVARVDVLRNRFVDNCAGRRCLPRCANVISPSHRCCGAECSNASYRAMPDTSDDVTEIRNRKSIDQMYEPESSM